MQALTAALGFLGILVVLLAISVTPFLFVYSVYCLVVWEFALLATLLYTYIFSIVGGVLLMCLSTATLKDKFGIK